MMVMHHSFFLSFHFSSFLSHLHLSSPGLGPQAKTSSGDFYFRPTYTGHLNKSITICDMYIHKHLHKDIWATSSQKLEYRISTIFKQVLLFVHIFFLKMHDFLRVNTFRSIPSVTLWDNKVKLNMMQRPLLLVFLPPSLYVCTIDVFVR